MLYLFLYNDNLLSSFEGLLLFSSLIIFLFFVIRYNAVELVDDVIDEHRLIDDELKIHGLQNIRVADASVMPEITSGNLNAPTLMIGERASDFIMNS
jgi:hypothetical protein